MKDSDNTIIYIGKAKSLKNRVSSYFRDNPSHTEKTKKMVSHVNDFDFIVTDSEYEALVLECSLIKQHKPKYNILLKDDKGYNYIKISNEQYPRITCAKKIEDNSKYIGPYTSSFTVKQTVNEVNQVFMLPQCNKKFPQQFNKSRPCLNFHIKRCMGLCNGNISAESYNETIKQAEDYIRNGSKNSIELLEKEMLKASENLDFEKAILLRNRIQAIKKSAESQKIIGNEFSDTDFIAMSESNNMICSAVLIYRSGKLIDKHSFFLGDDEENIFESFITQYYSQKDDIPHNIITEKNFESMEILQKMLTEKANHKVKIFSRQKGEALKYIILAKTNAAEYLALKINRTCKEVIAVEELAKILGLSKPPLYIEAYDISNLSYDSMVASMVVFENGRPLKSAYKKFSIKYTVGQNDYECMKEVLERRFSHYDKESREKTGFNRMPDLIFVDGGKGHINSVIPIIKSMGVTSEVFGIVKDGKHHTRAIMSEKGEVSVSDMKPVFHLITKIQDEMHRFAISYQRKKHLKNSINSELTKIKGIGEKKAQKLIIYYKTKENLINASADELSKVARLSKSTADELYNYLQTLEPF